MQTVKKDDLDILRLAAPAPKTRSEKASAVTFLLRRKPRCLRQSAPPQGDR